MTLKLMRALALWTGCLALMVISVLPLSLVVQASAAFGALTLVTGGWLLAGRRSVRLGGSLGLDEFRALPGSNYRLPVVLVCGEGSAALFAGDADADVDAAEQRAVRTTASGCYVGVPNIERLPGVAAALLAVRPQWRAQLSVMFVLNPAQHADNAVLAGQIRALSHQLSLIRRRALTLPLWVVSYQPASLNGCDIRGTGFSGEEGGSSTESVWFSWENGEPSARVRNNGTCVSVEDWQRQNAAALTDRLHIAVQMNTHAAWLAQYFAPHFARIGRHRTPLPVAYAICRVPRLPEQVPGSVWQQSIQGKTALVPTHLTGGTGGVLPVPDSLLELLPRHTGNSAARRAAVIGIWLTAFAAVVAMSSSARQNTLLIRQVGDDLRRYASINETAREDQQAVALRETALTVLHDHARRLDDYYRYGEPRSLGLGLYRAEQLRIRVWHAIGRYRAPTEMAQAPGPVRLDTLSLFNIGSAELKAESTQVLINALVGIKARPGWLIVVTGHTDATGSAEQNLRLSRDRAASVRDWMQRMGGIPGSCFAVQGYGASQPIASNDTEQGRRANRRVDIRLVPEEGACGSLSAGAGPATPVAFRGTR
ncbi:OmpA family protein [Pseudomonas petrae]|uniref:OmpA family protein n=1 Tax=Pseudomonas petrae TaxID=2912190 RepID=A0ABS9I1Q2_9PSED|nr:OmpA family protein [Pseudomonas petrae]MCF7532412.1 OmpA family protein [Pseudomonas petrae]MCF7536046.1 OmpA family protein [Pseudomonas petrae]MCF7541730.1 OmpA family protein [Pseudomonas petrae]MCF7557572.1 OmpA family protein [Pseudomonas petrae]